MPDRFIDFSAANNGDGTAANQAASNGATGAYNQFSLSDYVPATNYNIYVRRVSSTAKSGTFTFNQSGIHLIGWPISGDPLYSSRPASGTGNGWDADTQTHAIFGSVSEATRYIFDTTTNQDFTRIRFQNNNYPASITTITFCGPNTNIIFTNCYFFSNNTGFKVAVDVNSALVTNGSSVGPIFIGCIIESTRANTSFKARAFDGQLLNCQILKSTANGSGFGAVVEACDKALFENCLFKTTSLAGGQFDGLPSLLRIVGFARYSGESVDRVSNPTFIDCFLDNSITDTSDFNRVAANTLDIAGGCSIFNLEVVGPKITISRPTDDLNWLSLPSAPSFTGDYNIHLHRFIQTFPQFYSAVNVDITCLLTINNLKVLLADFFNRQISDPNYIRTYFGSLIIIRMMDYVGEVPGFSPMGHYYTPTSLDIYDLPQPGLMILDQQIHPTDFWEPPFEFGWKHASVHGILEIVNIFRIDSRQNISIKAVSNRQAVNTIPKAAYLAPMQISLEGMETIIARIAAAPTKTVTIHFQSTNPYLKEDVWCEFDYFDLSSGGHVLTGSSKLNDNFSLDGSAWSNILGNNYKSSVTVAPVGQTANCPIRIYYGDVVAGYNSFTLIEVGAEVI